jgi:catechol-2,3-dioxygenase
MKLKHLHIHCRNRAASEMFYARWIGLTVARKGECLTFMTDGDDFDLALMDDANPAPVPGWFHFGAKLGSAAEVQAAYRRMSEAGLPMRKALYDDEDLVSFRVEDPDGYAIEIYWERPGASLD